MTQCFFFIFFQTSLTKKLKINGNKELKCNKNSTILYIQKYVALFIKQNLLLKKQPPNTSTDGKEVNVSAICNKIPNENERK